MGSVGDAQKSPLYLVHATGDGAACNRDPYIQGLKNLGAKLNFFNVNMLECYIAINGFYV